MNGDPLAVAAEVNEGLKKRYKFIKNSNVVDMIGPIHSDIFFQDRTHVKWCGRKT